MTTENSKQEVVVVGRGVYALPLLRLLGQKTNYSREIKITFTTSVGWRDFGSVSRFVNTVVTVPRPDQDLEGWTTALCDIIHDKQRNVTILPVAEETLFLSLPKVIHRLKKANASVKILTSPHQDLVELHDKFTFQKEMAKLFGHASVPKTTLVHTEQEMMTALQQHNKNAASGRVVVKPVAGHGSIGAHVISMEDLEESSVNSQDLFRQYPVAFQETTRDAATRTLQVPYVVQEFVEGHEYSTFSLCLEGNVVAHVCYRPRHVATNGFSPIRDLAPLSVWKQSLKYVHKVASSRNLTGHFGLDMMQRFTGDLVALECNPRVTNGMAFLAPKFLSIDICEKLQRAYLGGSWEELTTDTKVISPMDAAPTVPHHIMSMIPTISSISKAKNSSESMQVLEVAVLSHDDVWWTMDPLPFCIMVWRFLSALLYAILLKLFLLNNEGRKPSEIVKSYIVEEVVCFEGVAASTMNTATETVGGIVVEPAKNTTTTEGKESVKVLVTGATGFLGGRVVRALHQGWDDKDLPLPEGVHAVTAVTATGRNTQKGQLLLESLDSSSSSNVETRFQAADLSNTQETYELVKGHDIVIHCAALCDLWTRWDDYVSANVTATENIAQACQLAGIKLLVHVSSPSLCMSVNTEDRTNIQETDPLPPDELQANRYSTTKKMAETIVTDIVKRHGLPCIILRPRAIFGPGDTTLFPVLLDRLKSGKLAQVGRGRECYGDFTYVDNVVAACLCCLDKTSLATGGLPKVYAITNDDHRRLWDIIDLLCDKLQLKKPWKRVPRFVAYHAAYIMEAFSAVLLLLLGYKKDPVFTRYTVNVVSRSSTFDISAAKKELGYKPVVPFDEGCKRFLDSLDC